MYHGSLLHVAVCGGSADSMYQGYDIHMQSYKATPNRHPNYHTIYYKFLDHSQCVVYMRTGTSMFLYAWCMYYIYKLYNIYLYLKNALHVSLLCTV